MQVLTTILYILLFLVFLSVLIIVHELGHLAAAKAFNVYCLEYSVGMGPLIYKKKRKNGETQFSLRAIPFGGYVSMYGEGVELPEGVQVSEERSLNGIKWWKRTIILLAGVTMNALLAIVFFFISNCLPQKQLSYINEINVSENSAAYLAGLRSKDVIKFDEWQYYDEVSNVQRTCFIADNQTTFNGDGTVKYATCYDFSSLSSINHLDYAEFTFFYKTSEVQALSGDVYKVTYTDGNTFKFIISSHLDSAEPKVTFDNNANILLDGFNSHIVDIYSGNGVTIESVKKIETAGELIPQFNEYVSPEFEKAIVHLTKRVPGENNKLVDGDVVSFEVKQENKQVSSYGVSLYSYTHQNNAGEAFVQTFKDFGNSSVTLVRAIGDLITKPKTWEQVGGIVAVGFQTTGVLQNFGFARFLYVWAFISVNLAIFNLLPFPGLDGWQLLVTIIEAITRKKIPEKVKNIVSFIGIALLFVLMGVIVIKDIITYVFAVML